MSLEHSVLSIEHLVAPTWEVGTYLRQSWVLNIAASTLGALTECLGALNMARATKHWRSASTASWHLSRASLFLATCVGSTAAMGAYQWFGPSGNPWKDHPTES